MDRPTREQIDEARKRLAGALVRTKEASLCIAFESQDDVFAIVEAVRLLLAATAPPDPGPPRPDDMGELACLVAKELRKRAVLADNELESVVIWRFVDSRQTDRFSTPRRFLRSMFSSDFDNLTPREIADVIQREEAAKAAEWAGDE